MRSTLIAAVILFGASCLVRPIQADQLLTDTKELRARIERFLGDESNPSALHPHIYMSILGDIGAYDDLLDLAEIVVNRGIELNTIENLSESLGDATEDLEREQNYEFSRLYSYKASILLRTERTAEAMETMEKAMTYIDLVGEPRAIDLLRLGLIQYANGDLTQGWDNIGEALIMDPTIERHRPEYRPLLATVISDMFGDALDMDDHIWEYRRDNRRNVHGLSFISLTGEIINLDNERGKVLCLTFFSPMCMSCREEVPCIKSTFEEMSKRPDVRFVFILNRPDLKLQASTFFKECGITTEVIATVTEGSAYDLISTEPTIWIVDREGNIATKLTGESVGSPTTYRDELLNVLEGS